MSEPGDARPKLFPSQGRQAVFVSYMFMFVTSLLYFYPTTYFMFIMFMQIRLLLTGTGVINQVNMSICSCF